MPVTSPPRDVTRFAEDELDSAEQLSADDVVELLLAMASNQRDWPWIRLSSETPDSSQAEAAGEFTASA